MKLILRILVLAGAIYVAYTACNTCSATTGLACVSNTQFTTCVSGVVNSTATPATCPTGYVCSSVDPVCAVSGTVTAECGMCGVCNGTNTFACTGLQTYALCSGTTTPGTTTYTCAGTTVCNIYSPYICENPATTLVGGTCTSVTTTSTTTTTTTTTTAATTTTPSPATSPTAYCAYKATSGRYDITTDTTCKTYVLCSLVSSAWVGTVYTCPGTTMFNATSSLCGTGTPTRCA